MPAVPNDAVLAPGEESGDPTQAKPEQSAERLTTEPEAGRLLTTPEGGRRPVAEDESTMVVGREAIQAMENLLAQQRSLGKTDPDPVESAVPGAPSPSVVASASGRLPTNDDRAVRVDRDLIAEMQAQLDRERMHRADTLPLPGGGNFDDPTPVRTSRLPNSITKTPLSIVPPGTTVPNPQATALADAAAAAGATAAVSAGITAGAFAAGTFGWAEPLVASSVGAVALAVVYLTARKFFTGFMRQR